MIDTVSEAIKNLRREGVRTFLTLIGVVIGIAAIVALLSAGQGLTLAVEKQLEQLGSNTIYVIPGNPYSSSSARITISDSDVDRMNSISGVTDVIPMYMASANAEYGNETYGALVLGIDAQDAKVFVDMGYYEVTDGRWLAKEDSSAIIIGDKMATDAFSKEISTKKILLLNGQEYKVVGIIKQLVQDETLNSSNTIMMNVDSIKKLSPGIGPAELWIRTVSAEEVNDAADKITSYFEKKYGEKSVYVVTSEQLLEQVQSIFGLITVFLVGIGSISIIVGGVGIMNAMVTSVTERTKEIGIMKALGATNQRILAIFLLESGFIGLVGGLIGLLIGYGLSMLVAIIGAQSGFPIEAAINWQITIGAMAFSMILGMLSGALPAWKAANLDPIEALRYE